jgi:hypothetical protein
LAKRQENEGVAVKESWRKPEIFAVILLSNRLIDILVREHLQNKR